MANEVSEDALKAELVTHGKTCQCAHKKMCEDREEWLVAEIARRGVSEDVELKPCPFCGSHAHVRGSQSRAYWVECVICEVGTKYGDSIKQVAEVWNTRANSFSKEAEDKDIKVAHKIAEAFFPMSAERSELRTAIAAALATARADKDQEVGEMWNNNPSHSTDRVVQDIQLNAGKDEAWPLADVLRKLAFAAEHLGVWHDCDHHGYEEILAAKDAAYRYLASLPITQAGSGFPSQHVPEHSPASLPESKSSVSIESTSATASEGESK